MRYHTIIIRSHRPITSDEVYNNMASIINLVIGIVTAVVGFVIVDSVVAATSWNNTLSGTIATYVVPIGLLGVLGMAAFMSSA